MSDLIKPDSSDEQLIAMWLHGRPASTQATYSRIVKSFQSFTAKPLQQITLEDLQRYASSLEGLKDSSRRSKLNAIKSLFSFAAKLQYVRFNVAAALRLPKAQTTLAGRILNKEQVLKLLDAESGRDRAFLRFVYSTGVRVSEACGVRWDDFQQRGNRSVQVCINGKGGKQRVVIVPEQVWAELRQLQANRADTDAVFGFNRVTAHRIVKAAAVRAGLPKVSAHWLRHCHAVHSLENGAPIHLVRDTLGHSSVATTNFYLESNPQDSSSKYLGF